jgi:hypothetical protein
MVRMEDVGVLVTPRVPGGHALFEHCDVLIVRHLSIPVPIRIFSPMKVLCKDKLPRTVSNSVARMRCVDAGAGPTMIRGSFPTQLVARVPSEGVRNRGTARPHLLKISGARKSVVAVAGRECVLLNARHAPMAGKFNSAAKRRECSKHRRAQQGPRYCRDIS